MRYKILNTQWRSSGDTIGFVAYATENPNNPGEWNSVVGIAPSWDDKADEQWIAAYGSKLEWQVAEVMFPNLDITKHKYYERKK